MHKKKILYAIVGVGLGNLSRTLAILEELPADKYEINFIAQGKAYELIKARYHTFRFEEVVYSGSNNFNLLNVIKKNYLFPLKFLQNVKKAAQILDSYKPDVLIVDSDFYCFFPAKKRRIPIISVNSSPATVIKFREFRTSVFEKFFSYYCIESVDAYLQKKFPDLVICPIITPLKNLSGKYKQVNPIVRRQFLEQSAASSKNAFEFEYDVALIIGGSGIGSRDIDLRSYNGKCLAIGQSGGLQLPANAQYIGFSENPAEYLSRAKILVVQGGFNSVSEVIALQKPSVIVPIKGHSEQFANAKWVEKLGLGIASEGDTVVKALEQLEKNYEHYIENFRKNAIRCTGAAEAAQLLQEFIDG